MIWSDKDNKHRHLPQKNLFVLIYMKQNPLSNLLIFVLFFVIVLINSVTELSAKTSSDTLNQDSLEIPMCTENDVVKTSTIDLIFNRFKLVNKHFELESLPASNAGNTFSPWFITDNAVENVELSAQASNKGTDAEISDDDGSSINTDKTEPKVELKQNPSPSSRPVVIIAPEELDHLFESYGNQYGVNSNTLKIIAKCESTFNPNAVSPSGLYGGLFQFSPATWISTRRSMGLEENPDLRFNPEEAIRTTAYKISQSGVGAWPTCGKRATAVIISS
jgi:hypothetical protein